MKTEYPFPAVKGEKLTYTVNEVATMLSVHRNTVYKLVRERAFESRKVGTDIRIYKASFDDWFNNQ